MRYMLLVYSEEQAWTDEQRAECMKASTELCRKLAEEGALRAASPLHPVAMATSVRLRDGKRLVTDGPFAETREQLGGYYIIEVEDLDRAIEIAGEIPGAAKGAVEIRPILELEGLGGAEVTIRDGVCN